MRSLKISGTKKPARNVTERAKLNMSMNLITTDMMNKDLNTPIWQLTVGEFLELQKKEDPAKAEVQNQPNVAQKYVYGIAGIAELFNCSKTTANAIKQSGKIDKATRQVGRKIIVDASLALELVGKKK